MSERQKRRIYAAQTLPGLERIAWEEIQRELRPVSLVRHERGLVLFSYDGPPAELLALRTTEDVFVVVAQIADLSPARYGLTQLRDSVLAGTAWEDALAVHRELHRQRVKRITYRVVAQKTGAHDFRRVDAQEAVERAIATRQERWKLVAEDAHLEIWLHIQDRLAITMLRLSDRTMRHRRYKLAHIPASLRPTLAAAMVLLSLPDERDVFVDPFCGAGTILIERVLGGKAAAILGGDLDPEALVAARANTASFERIQLARWDATHLPLRDGSVDKVVSNLPFGKQIGSPERNERLYREFFIELERVLRPRGRAVLLTSARPLMETLLESGPFRSRHVVPVWVLGQPATIYVLERKRG